jgi:putative FmdB family regulatory protein
MPIYAYRCTSCGHAKDVLQKVSDPLLTECPACGAATFAKQVTAAGFQLKGSGWYVTDFRGGNNAAGKAEGDADKAASSDKATEGSVEKADSKAVEKADGKVAEKAAGSSNKPGDGSKSPTKAKAAPAPAPAPAAATPAPAAAAPPAAGG